MIDYKNQTKWLLNEVFRAGILKPLVAAALASAGYGFWRYWPYVSAGFMLMPTMHVLVGALVLFTTAIFDFVVTLKIRRLSYSIIAPYVAFILIFLLLTGGAHSAEAADLVAIYALLAFLAVRFASQALEAADGWFAASKSNDGLAVTSILLIERHDKNLEFVLVKNENLNGNSGLWVSPGGRWSIGTVSPERRLLAKIAEETNYSARIRYLNPIDSVAPPLTELANDDCIWFQPPHFLLYETLNSRRTNFPSHHLDLVYICTTNGEGADQTPRYGPSKQIFVPIDQCMPNFAAAHSALSQAISNWDTRATGQTRSRHNDVSADVVWRMHLAAKVLGRLEVDRRAARCTQ